MARREELLNQLKDEISKEGHDIDVIIKRDDLSETNDVYELYNSL